MKVPIREPATASSRSIYEEFCSRLVAGVRAWKVGNPLEEATKVGPLVSAEHMGKVLSYIEIGEAEGAKKLTGGHRIEEGALAAGNYVAPTIFADVNNSMRICQDEIFGPVATVMPFDQADEAIAIANHSRYGLAGMVWTKNLDVAHHVARSVKTGNMWVNCFYVRDLRLPFGGYRESGIGREGGDFSYDFFTESKAVVIKLGPSVASSGPRGTDS